MKGRVGVNRGGGGGGGGGGAPTDLLVCFPSRGHLSLMPKPICSPSRPSNPSNRHHSRLTNRGQASPLFRTRITTTHQTGSDSQSDEPTSPKVNCTGQIRSVRPKSRTGPRPDTKTWLDSLGLKKDVLQFLGALRSFRFSMRCFGSLHGSIDCNSDDDEEEGEEEEEEEEKGSSIFSKWFMVLEEKQSDALKKEEIAEAEEGEEEEEEEEVGPVQPPPNALLLMRCRSAPAKEWMGEEETGERRRMKEMEEQREDERLALMSYAPDFFKVSTEIAKETWVVGSVDPLARSRSWRR